MTATVGKTLGWIQLSNLDHPDFAAVLLTTGMINCKTSIIGIRRMSMILKKKLAFFQSYALIGFMSKKNSANKPLGRPIWDKSTCELEGDSSLSNWTLDISVAIARSANKAYHNNVSYYKAKTKNKNSFCPIYFYYITDLFLSLCWMHRL